MKKFIRLFSLAIYYGFARFLPTQPVPGWRIAYALRRILVRRIFDECGNDVIVKSGAYFGTGSGIRVGHRAQIGHNSRIDHGVDIGDDVLMGPDVVIMSGGHAFSDPSLPINQQGEVPRRKISIGRDVWIGTRVVILPGVQIGEGAVIGASSVVTKSIPPFAVAAGNPAKVIKWRRQATEAAGA
jgi:maltose O-acetyltransferase